MKRYRKSRSGKHRTLGERRICSNSACRAEYTVQPNRVGDMRRAMCPDDRNLAL